MSLGEANSIIHRFQVTYGVHVHDDLRHFIENKVMQAVQRENKTLEGFRDEWRQSDLTNRFPPVTYIHKKKIRIKYTCKRCAFSK